MKNKYLIVLIVILAIILVACLTVGLWLSATTRSVDNKKATDIPTIISPKEETQEQSEGIQEKDTVPTEMNIDISAETEEREVEKEQSAENTADTNILPTEDIVEETNTTAPEQLETVDSTKEETQPIRDEENNPPAEEVEPPFVGENGMGWA